MSGVIAVGVALPIIVFPIRATSPLTFMFPVLVPVTPLKSLVTKLTSPAKTPLFSFVFEVVFWAWVLKTLKKTTVIASR